MDRRSFLLWAGAGAAGLGSAAGFFKWQEITPRIHEPGKREGHFLRDLVRERRALPPPSYSVTTDVAIFGSGIAGLTAAWKLAKGGHHDFLMIDGPQPFGNAAGGRYGELAFPTGAHYLPLPSPSCFHVREILSDAGIILRNASGERPYYDERFLLHAPEERLLINGKWQEGLIPHDGLPPWEVEEQRRFLADMERLRTAHGKDGKPAFTLPSALSSNDPQWRALDGITMKAWMESHGFRSPALHWYVNYCCRDDYGARYDRVSAWAGLHYFCGRSGEAENAEKGAWLTWPGGLQPLADVLARACEGRRRNGTAARIRMGGKGIEATCIEWINGQPRSYTVHARKAICAMPLFVAARVVEPIAEFGFDPEAHMPAYAPWMVTNFLMKAFPQELPEAPLSWDNVVYGEPGLGYVVSTHQDVRVRPPEKTVFTSYAALTDRTPEEARRWLDGASPGELLEFAAADLKAAYGWRFGTCVERADITLRAHAMATPQPGFLANEGLKGLREADGVLLFAHSDLSGFSVFEEAAWWGYQAALRAVA